MRHRHPLSEPVELECLECTVVFLMPEKVYREQDKVFCPKCGGNSLARTTTGKMLT
jgi:Zn finger protein HypA/HybF involved in hydrogenase expression